MNYLVTHIGDGSLHVMAAPKPRQLHNHMRYLKMQGITKVLSLMQPEEADQLLLSAEEHYCQVEGLKFENFPIVDHSVTDKDRLQPLVRRLLNEIEGGEQLVVHCFAGIGRTGIVSCCLLIENGLSAEEAVALVSEKRQLQVPETAEQLQFVKNYEAQL